ncbi:MAG: hypothetical protein KF842_10450 [Caulobacter sp.]|nr:hypothetical protein [Caulobacter sp.]
MRIWGVVLAIVAMVTAAATSSAQPKPDPNDPAFWRTPERMELCAAVYAFRHREEKTSARGQVAKAAATAVIREVMQASGRSAVDVDGAVIAKANKLRAGLMGQAPGFSAEASDIEMYVQYCDKAFGQKVGEAWTPHPSEDPVWNNKAQLVCATFYQRATVKAPLQAGRNEASRAAPIEIGKLAKRLDRTYPETMAIVRKNVGDFEIALKDGRITEGKILETIDTCDHYYSYYVADNYAPPPPFDCQGAMVSALNKGGEALAKTKGSTTRGDNDTDHIAYYVGMSCGHLKTALRDMQANSCPAELVSRMRGQYDDMVKMLAQYNDGSHVYYSCSLTP